MCTAIPSLGCVSGRTLVLLSIPSRQKESLAGRTSLEHARRLKDHVYAGVLGA